MADRLRITMIQAPIAWEDRDANLAAYGRLIRRAGRETDLIVLPETFTTGFTMNVEAVADPMDGPTVATLKTWAAEHRAAIAGSFIAGEENRYYNRAFFVTPDGGVSYYDKRHLFRMAGEDKRFTPGGRPVIVGYQGWNICLQVCYDLRFPVWSRNVDNAYDLLLYAANWPGARIGAWNVLLPARAVENMAFVCGVNRTGIDGNGIPYSGHSAVYSPKGEQIAGAGTAHEQVVDCILAKDDLERLRTRFPAWMDADTFILPPA
jgi:predicted amidohydrolase